MSVGEITGYVYVGSARLADTADDYQSGTPTALAGLSMTWGRDGPQSQPDIGSCSLTVADREGDADFLGALKVGAPLTIYAAVETDTGQPADVAVDPGFGSDLRWRISAPGVVVVDDPGKDAIAPPGHSARLTRSNASIVVIPVAPFTKHAGGWIGIPRVTGPGMAGQVWRVTVGYRVGPIAGGAIANWQLRYFTDSLKQSGTALTSWASFGKQANTYVTVGGDYVIPADLPGDYWLGIAIDDSPGPAWNSVIPVGLTWAQVPAGSWADVGRAWLDEFHALAPAVNYRRATVFNGRITDLAASAWGEAVQVAITASDWTAELANENIGTEPFTIERLDSRAENIIGYSSIAPDTYTDPRCAVFMVSWLDVDKQPVYGLLQDLATTGDGILWPRFDTLWIEDPDTRSAAVVLAPDPVNGQIVITGARGTTGGIVLDSCDVLRDGLTLEQTAEDIITRVSLTWLDQTLDESGNQQPTDVTLFVDDELAQDEFGIRELSVSTQLTKSADALAVANRKLARSKAGSWHANGLTWDTATTAPNDQEHLITALTLLDMSARIGLLLTVTDVPSWIPLGPDLSAYLEGGTYRYSGGRWQFELGLSPSSMSGTSAKWTELDPAWPWQLFDSSIVWSGLWGVGSSFVTTTKGKDNAEHV